jgi:hypothetical protein
MTRGAYPAEAGEGPICIITAHNPRGEERTDAANRRLHRDLINWLEAEGLTFYPAAGGDRGWLHVEESVAVIGIDVEREKDIGRVVAQEAVFVWTPQLWQLVGCDDDSVVTLGWVAPSPSEELTRIDAACRALNLESPLAPKPVVYAALETNWRASTT